MISIILDTDYNPRYLVKSSAALSSDYVPPSDKEVKKDDDRVNVRQIRMEDYLKKQGLLSANPEPVPIPKVITNPDKLKNNKDKQ